MKKQIIISFIFLLIFTNWSFNSSGQELKDKLRDYYFDLPLGKPFDTLKALLIRNPDFKLFNDPNRDNKLSLVGSMACAKHLNPAAIRNQVVISFLAKKKQCVTFKWSIDYRMEDLPQAINDFEKMKIDFKPFFSDITEKSGVGFHQEQTESLFMKKDEISVTIRILKFNNLSHTISLEYAEER